MIRVPQHALRAAVFAVVAAAGLLPGAAPSAFAKAPAGALSAEDLIERSKRAEADRIAREAEAARDPVQEAIDAYRTGVTPIAQYQKLTDIVSDSKTKDMDRYRVAAADALVKRFATVDCVNDKAMAQLRREVGLAVVELMKANPEDVTGLACVNTLFETWWRTQHVQFGFKPTAKKQDRQRAYDKMRKFLRDKD
jgi:hypothetical protein